MKFCSVCDNMMYMRLANDESAAADVVPESAEEAPPEAAPAAVAALRFYCKNCGYAVDASSTDTKGKMLDTDYKDDQATYSQYATPHIVHDPTLPRVSNIPCPLKGCTRPADVPNEVIYVKYDATNLRFLYYCCHCTRFWKSGQAAAPAAVPA